MLNNLAKLEVKIDGKIYQLLCDVDSPIGQVHDALSQMKLYVINKMKEVESPPTPEEPINE